MKRIRYFDILRVIAFAMITFYHAVVQFVLSEVYPIEAISKYYENANLHIATLGVSIFFMLSGAGLMLSTREEIDVKTFYRKRLTRLMVPFYIMYVLCVIVRLVLSGAVHEAFPAEIPRWRLIFSVIGMDGLLKNYGVETFYNVGEWFLGAILIFYVLFPLFRFLLKKQPAVFFGAATLLAGVIIAMYPADAELPMHMSLLLKGYDFIIGMMIGYFAERIPGWIRAAAAVVFAVFLFCPVVIPVSDGVKIPIAAASAFLACSWLEGVLNRRPWKALDVLSSHSYEAFLAHHVVIFVVTPVAFRFLSGPAAVAACFAVELALIVAGAVIVKQLAALFYYLPRRKRDREEHT